MSTLSNSNARTIVVMHGDQTGEELLLEALRVLVPAVIGLNLDFQHFDLSLENRRTTKNEVVKEAAAAMRQSGLGMKAATITPTEPNDVGSPNAILREEIDGRVILRTGRRIPRVRPVGGVHAPISVVRMAVDDAYGAKEWRETTPDGDELAYRTSKISRETCRCVADFSFQLAERNGARVFGGPKYTVSPVYEGMFKEELDAAAAENDEEGGSASCAARAGGWRASGGGGAGRLSRIGVSMSPGKRAQARTGLPSRVSCGCEKP